MRKTPMMPPKLFGLGGKNPYKLTTSVESLAEVCRLLGKCYHLCALHFQLNLLLKWITGQRWGDTRLSHILVPLTMKGLLHGEVNGSILITQYSVS